MIKGSGVSVYVVGHRSSSFKVEGSFIIPEGAGWQLARSRVLHVVGHHWTQFNSRGCRV